MKFGARVVTYLVVGVAAAALSAWTALSARVPVEVAPVAPGEPTMHLVSYNGSDVAGALALAAIAGIFLVVAVSRGVRDRREAACIDTPQGYHEGHGDD